MQKSVACFRKSCETYRSPHKKVLTLCNYCLSINRIEFGPFSGWVNMTHASDGEIVPGYKLISVIGKGSAGEVWRGRGPGGTECALKLINIERKLVVKELRAIHRVKNIHHPNLVPVFGVWLKDPTTGKFIEDSSVDSNLPVTLQLIIAMGLAESTLSDRLEECHRSGQRGIPLDELLNYMENAAKGIDFLNSPRHDLGHGMVSIQHCDIKPSNIVIVGGAAQICDFGLAQVLESDCRVSSTRICSPAYAAPELFGTGAVPSTDQYSLAITYYELRTGRLPIEGPAWSVIRAHCTGELDFSSLGTDELAVIRKATSLNSQERFNSTQEMVRRLRDTVKEELVTSPEVTKSQEFSCTGSGLPNVEAANSGSGMNLEVPFESQPGQVGAYGQAENWFFKGDRMRKWTSRDSRLFRPVLAISVLTIVSAIPIGMILRLKLEVMSKPVSVTFDPPGVLVSINGGPEQSLPGSGTIPIKATERDSFTFRIRDQRGQYEPLSATYTSAELKSGHIRVRLRRYLRIRPNPGNLQINGVVQPLDKHGRVAIDTFQNTTFHLVARVDDQWHQPLDQRFSLEELTAMSFEIFMPTAQELPNPYVNSIGVSLGRIAPGTFQMGSGDNDKPSQYDEKPRHTVVLTNAFYMAEHEITVAQFRQFSNETNYRTDAEKTQDKGGAPDVRQRNWRSPGFAQTDKHPVVFVSWNDSQEFCKWLTEKEGKTYRLPTEAEWEFAARGGTVTRYFSGDDATSLQGFANIADSTFAMTHPGVSVVSWNDGKEFTAPLDLFKPNPYGLFHMLGNVSEWVQDSYDSNYYRLNHGTNPQGPAVAAYRVYRGGSFRQDERFCRSAIRSFDNPENFADDRGFRIILECKPNIE